MSIPDFARSYNAEGAIVAYSIVKIGANDYGVLQAGAATDKIIGVSTDIDSASGERCDVFHEGICYVKIAGTVTRGDWITSNASGLGVTAAPAAGTNNYVIGMALQSGVSGDIIEVMVDPTMIQG